MTTGTHAASTAQYVIYSFLKTEPGSLQRRGADPWQHMATLGDVAEARERARSLFSTARYSRVELRKKFISERTGAAMDIALEVLDRDGDRDIRSIKCMLLLAMGCAIAALALSLVLQA